MVVTSTLLPEALPRAYEESQIQRAVVNFLRWALPDDAAFYSIPNEGQRGRKAVARLVGMGLRAGMPDLGLCYKGRTIFIELKTPVGRLSPSQRQMHRKLIASGAEVLVLRSLEGVVNALMEMGVPLKARLS